MASGGKIGRLGFGLLGVQHHERAFLFDKDNLGSRVTLGTDVVRCIIFQINTKERLKKRKRFDGNLTERETKFDLFGSISLLIFPRGARFIPQSHIVVLAFLLK